MGMPAGKECTDCGNLYFETIIGYNIHRDKVHSGNGYIGDVYKCDTCNFWARNCSGLNAHKSSTGH
jgi:hypothetical protein